MTTEERREYYRNWKEKNAERVKELNRNWREKNAERNKERKRKWNEKNAEREIQRAHDRYNNNPAHRGYRLFHKYKRSDIEKNVAPADPSEYPTQEEVNEMLLQPCVWCGESDWHKIGLDRKDNRFGHVRSNIQPCCWSCNNKKGKLSNEEFRQALAEGRIKLKAVKTVKAETCDPAIPAMPSMRSLLI